VTTGLHKAGDRWTENEATELVNLIETENFKNNLLNTWSTSCDITRLFKP